MTCGRETSYRVSRVQTILPRAIIRLQVRERSGVGQEVDAVFAAVEFAGLVGGQADELVRVEGDLVGVELEEDSAGAIVEEGLDLGHGIVDLLRPRGDFAFDDGWKFLSQAPR